MRFGMKLRSSAAGRIPDARIGGDEAGATGSEPAAMIAFVEADGLRAFRRLDPAGVLADVNLPSPVTTLTFRCFASPAEPAVRRLTTPSFQPRMAVEIDSGSPKLTPCDAHRPGLVDDLGDMQQRLGRDAADIEADAAEGRAASRPARRSARDRRRGRRPCSRRGLRPAPGCRPRSPPGRRIGRGLRRRASGRRFRSGRLDLDGGLAPAARSALLAQRLPPRPRPHRSRAGRPGSPCRRP